jgi:hypothetical protein
MSRSLTFVYLDGREIQGVTPREVLEALRAGEPGSASDLGRFLDLIYSRAALTFSIALDVGDPRASLDARCRAALASLVQHGWLRIKEDRVSWPRARSSASMAERKVSTAAA